MASLHISLSFLVGPALQPQMGDAPHKHYFSASYGKAIEDACGT
jgi:hypothetical protein